MSERPALRLAENAVTVAAGLCDNSFRNTAQFVAASRKAMQGGFSRPPARAVPARRG